MRNLTFPVIVLIALLFSGCSKSERVAYYGHMDFSGLHDIRLKYPLNPDTLESGYYFKVVYDGKGRITSLTFPDVGGQGNDPEVNYSAIQISYSKKQEKRSFFDGKGKPTFSNKNIYYEDFRLNSRGFPESMTNLDSTSQATEDTFGVSKYLFTSDDKGLITDCLGLDLKGNAITDMLGNYRTKYLYDDNGLIIEKANYDMNGVLAEKANGVAIIRYKYDFHGNILEETYFDEHDYPKAHSKYNYASCQYSYNEAGQMIEGRYLDLSGNLAKDISTKYPIEKIIYGENGVVSGYGFYDESKALRWSMKFDPYGRNTESKFFNSEGKLDIDSAGGYAIHISEFDSVGNKVTENYYDAKMQLMNLIDSGFATARLEYNSQNNLTKCRWYDSEGKPCENRSFGCAAVTYTYNYPKGIATATCRDTRGIVKECRYGYAVRQSRYKDGKIVEDRYLDKAGNLITDRQFDTNGRPVEAK